MLHEKNATFFQGFKPTRTHKCSVSTRERIPCNLHSLCTAVSEESENSLFPGEGPAAATSPTLSSEFPPPEEREVFHMTLISRLEGRGGGGRKRTGELGGESPSRARPQPRFSHAHVRSSVPPGCAVQTETDGEGGRSHLTWSETFTQQRRQRGNRRHA